MRPALERQPFQLFQPLFYDFRDHVFFSQAFTIFSKARANSAWAPSLLTSVMGVTTGHGPMLITARNTPFEIFADSQSGFGTVMRVVWRPTAFTRCSPLSSSVLLGMKERYHNGLGCQVF